MPEDTRIEVNRAMRRRAKFFGVSRDVAIVLMAITVLCLILGSSGLPPNMAIALFVTLFFTALFVLKDGTGELLAKTRKPRHYTRGCFDYQSPLNNNSGGYEKEEES
jgi:hypothetical protein